MVQAVFPFLLPLQVFMMLKYFRVALLAYLNAIALCEDPTAKEIASVAGACNQFSLDLNGKVLKPGANGFFSSYSICTAMAMVLAGAAGNTETQLRNTFHYSANQKVDPIYKKFIEDFSNPKNSNYKLITANRIYGAKNFQLNEMYQSTLETYYKAPLQQVDFTSGTAEGIINTWVSEQTSDKIKDLFASGSLGPDTKLVLVNAIYFKGTWLSKFNKATTKKESFKVSQETTQQVDMMSLENSFPYLEDADLNAQILHMLYSGDRLRMLVILPKEDFGLEGVMKKLSGEKIKKLLDVSETTVKVKFPKFKLETEYELTKALAELKSTDVFSNSANLSRISETSLKVNQVKHKAFLQVDEEGTEAAAATGVQLTLMSATIYLSEPPQFIADHPFYFAIVDKSTGLILFSGQMLDPTKAN